MQKRIHTVDLADDLELLLQIALANGAAIVSNRACPDCSRFPADGSLVCFSCTGTRLLDTRVTVVLTDAVTEAIALIRDGHPGRAEFRLARAQLRAAALLDQVDEAAAIEDLRYYEYGNPPAPTSTGVEVVGR